MPKEKTEEVAGVLVDSFVEASAQYAGDTAKELTKDIVGEGIAEIAMELGIDTAASVIPGIGGAITSYRYNQKLRKLGALLVALSHRSDEIESSMKLLSEENKEKLDSIMELMVEKSMSTMQEEKINYMVNGFVEIAKHEEISFDIAYLYYDTLDRLTLLDIGVLNFYASLGIDQKTYKDVLEEFSIDYSQYTAVRENLNRMGLVQTALEINELDDLKNIVSTVDAMQDSLESVTTALSNPKKKFKNYKKSRLKLKSKDNMKITKFGKELMSFFISE
ncbi:hypothetical protein PGRAN_02585 [Listeria grandensis FSL F6-0971]|uniref:Uncharacterized protein n=1 Tax=Listeria grandensis FSL F6-0971 TaxID=1265819 RepID=W7BNX2_9LIST|nr:hypothetical protein [Listeria grandensis]EUJ24746.1 hypothetical protein PGRAN_02585 [Listeria grandensis FSL F6-0971]